MRRLVRFVLFALAIVPAVAAGDEAAVPQAFHGVWGRTPQACERGDAEGRVQISKRDVMLPAYACRVTALRREGEDAVHVQASCLEEGESEPEADSMRLRLAAPGRLTIETSQGLEESYAACPGR
jgi:hypothetical protein